MSADPEPDDRPVGFNADRSVIVADASYPIVAHFLKVQRRVSVVLAPQPVSFVSEALGTG